MVFGHVVVLNDEIVSRHGKRLKQRLDTLCVHGDEPSGVIVVTLPEMVLG